MLNRLRGVIDRLLSDHDSDEDRRVAQVSLFKGDLLFGEGERNVIIGGDSSGIVVSGNENRIVVQLGKASYQTIQEKLFPPFPGIAPPAPSLLFLGRDKDIVAIKNLLGVGADKSGSSLVIVEGWPGVGKTSIAGMLGRDYDVLAKFPDGVLWAALGQSPNMFSVLATWCRTLGADDLLRLPTINELTARLSIILSKRKMLLIIDDVWEVGHATPLVSIRSPACGVLITTRLPQVSEGFTNVPIFSYRLPVLEEADGLRLLWALAPRVVDQEEHNCRLLVRDLECLPLALHVAGRLLRSEAKLGWGVGELVEDIRTGAAIIRAKAPEDRTEEGCTPTVAALLSRSTDFLEKRTR